MNTPEKKEYTTAKNFFFEEDRPREKLAKYGVENLSNSELLAILLNTGIRGKNVRTLSKELQEKINNLNEMPSIQELLKISGLGVTKASIIVAMLEFGRRRWGMRKARIRTPNDAFSFLRHYAESPQEQFFSISLNCACEVISVRTVTVGLVDRTIAHPREVFAGIITDRAAAAIIAHNHPSGCVEPSVQDNEITTRLVNAAQIFGIRVFDHIIFTDTHYFSYKAAGKLADDNEMYIAQEK
jgi:DNA repair protein RadC